MLGVAQYLFWQNLPDKFFTSLVFHAPFGTGIGSTITIDHIAEGAKYILIHGVTFSNPASANPFETMRFDGMLYLRYLGNVNIAGTHMVPHIVQAGRTEFKASDTKAEGIVHYQFIKHRGNQ